MYQEHKAPGEVQEKTFPEICNRAAALIEERGNAKGQFYLGRSLCTFAALYEAEKGCRIPFGYDGPPPATRRVERWLGGSVCAYNNTHTKEEVVAMLRRAGREA